VSETVPDFEGKVVYVYARGLSKGYDDGIALEGCQLRNIGGRKFIVGTTVEQIRPEWTPGPETSVAWDAVTAFLLYPTREGLVAAFERAGRGSGGEGKGRGLFSRIFGGGEK
jgi:hypothetical protein